MYDWSMYFPHTGQAFSLCRLVASFTVLDRAIPVINPLDMSQLAWFLFCDWLLRCGSYTCLSPVNSTW
jgi:hypothetical protein